MSEQMAVGNEVKAPRTDRHVQLQHINTLPELLRSGTAVNNRGHDVENDPALFDIADMKIKVKSYQRCRRLDGFKHFIDRRTRNPCGIKR
jgi:hypothetical protein